MPLHKQSAAANRIPGRHAPRKQSKKQSKTRRSEDRKEWKSKPSAKQRPPSTGQQFPHGQVCRMLAALERSYGKSAEQRQIFLEMVRRPSDEMIELIVANEWSGLRGEVGRTPNPYGLIKAALELKQYYNQQAAAEARDASRKQERSERPEPFRRSPMRTKSPTVQR